MDNNFSIPIQKKDTQTIKGIRNIETVFAINIYSVFPSWPIPKSIQKRLAYNSDIKLTISISLSFYHVPSKRFFGSTFVSGEVEYHAKDDSKNDSIFLNELIYFCPKYDRGDMQLIIVELIANEYSRKTGTKQGVYGCGWTLLRIPTTKDAERKKNVIQEYRSVPLNLGTPKILLRMIPNEIRAICDSSDSSGFQIQYELWVCSHDLGVTLRSNALIKYDELIGACEPIPGLRKIQLVLQNGKDISENCIGGVSASKNSLGLKSSKLTPVSQLHLATSLAIHLSALRLVFPNGRKRFEASIVNGVIKTNPFIEVQRDYLRFLGITFRKNAKSKLMRVAKASITGRSLRIGVHNGHSLIGQDDNKWSEIELYPSDSDPNVLICNRSSYSLPIFFDHPLCAIVVLSKYNLELSVTAQDRSTMRNYSKKLDRATQINVTAGYQIILPFQRAGGPAYLESLSVHSPLLHDATCTEFFDGPAHTSLSTSKDVAIDMQVNWKSGKSNLGKGTPKVIEFMNSDLDTRMSSITQPSIRWKDLEGFKSSRIDSQESLNHKSENIYQTFAIPVSTQTGGSLSTEKLSRAPLQLANDSSTRLKSSSHLLSLNEGLNTNQKKNDVAKRLVESEPTLQLIIKRIAGYLLINDEHLLSYFGFKTDGPPAESKTREILNASYEYVDTFYVVTLCFLQWYRSIHKMSFLRIHVEQKNSKIKI